MFPIIPQIPLLSIPIKVFIFTCEYSISSIYSPSVNYSLPFPRLSHFLSLPISIQSHPCIPILYTTSSPFIRYSIEAILLSISPSMYFHFSYYSFHLIYCPSSLFSLIRLFLFRQISFPTLSHLLCSSLPIPAPSHPRSLSHLLPTFHPVTVNISQAGITIFGV